MLHSVRQVEGHEIHATDGKVGSATDVYFDDAKWVVRYLVVNTGGWLMGRRVLVSPYAVKRVDSGSRVIVTNLTRDQVQGSPDIDTDKPVSRQMEEEYHRYYGYPEYWPYATYWAWGAMPVTVPPADVLAQQEEDRQRSASKGDSHLRSSRDVTGYHIQALDEPVGHVEDFLFDDQTWVLRYLVVDTRNWLPGRHVLISTSWVRDVSWADRTVSVDLTRTAIENSPAYDPRKLPSREYEESLHRHYSRPGYWT